MVYGFSKHYYLCKCDCCGAKAIVEENLSVYNGAQAVRSLGWSFGRDKRVLCKTCRRSQTKDKK